MAVKLVYSLDHGHGESCVSFIRIRDDNGQPIADISAPKTLYIKANELKVYSNVLYDDNGKAIDFGVSMAVGNLAAYFKRSPQKWDNEKIKAGKVSKTSKEVMSDFIRMIMDAVRANDNNKVILPHVENDECALYVGCPSDVMWTNDCSIQKYEELIREAAGIDEVHVVPESTAAIISMVSKMPENALRDGVCVFDFGSSTADFTFIKLGKVLIETSWTLGASKIEANIINKVFADNEIDMNKIWHGDDNSRELYARKEIKEAWFGDAAAPGYVVTSPDGIEQTIKYVRTDEFGVPKTRNQNGRAIPDTAYTASTIDNDFMDDVINNMPVRDVSESGTPYPDDSWSGHCKEFFRKCHKLITKNGYDCSAVILTGGASRMPFIAELCGQEFSIDPIRDDSPSFSVANGLCQVAVNDMRLEDIKSELKNGDDGFDKKKEAVLKQYIKDAANSLSDHTYNLICQYAEDKINSGTGIVKRVQFEKDVNDKMHESFTVQMCNNLLMEPIQTMNDSGKNCIEDFSDLCATKLYPNQISSNFRIDKNVLDSYNLTTPINEQISINVYAVYNAIKKGFVAFVGWFFADKINLRKIADPDNETRMKNSLMDSFKSDVVPTILKQQFDEENKAFHDKMSEMFDYALDAVALKKFDKRITG